ncbi:recombinase family protein [Granulicella sp. L46]|uniref:recombinase family protein n=1 Tax=Granulicella sp. L46 TaxID=1641865 RepID=UPI00131E3CEB|nr:recombinase family protein [Granulicella sp. L46]
MIPSGKPTRCAIYTRKSSEEGLDQSFNSLHAQREACEAFVLSQKHEGWQMISAHYDDGGFSGGNMERPGLKKLLTDISAGKVDTVVVYKVDRLTRSLSDFARIVESFDSKGVSFVSVTQQFNTTSSMGRLTLNVLLSFAQFEREVTGERIRDKVAASKKKGMWMGGLVPLGYDLANHQLVVNPKEAEVVRKIFALYLELRSVTALQENLKGSEIRSKRRTSSTGRQFGGSVLSRGTLYHLLNNTVYIGKTIHKGVLYPGKHEPIVDVKTWDRSANLLKENRVSRKTKHNLASGRMLQGRLTTADGKIYTPTHANKNGRRYFYYMLRDKGYSAPIRCLPAVEIETRVLFSISSFLADPIRVADQFPGLDVRDMKLLISAARHRAALLIDGTVRQKDEVVGLTRARIVVMPSELLIEIDRGAIGREFLGREANSEVSGLVEIREPFQFARRGSEVRLILTSDEQPNQDALPSLVKAVTLARTWYKWIVNGEIRTMRELARRAGMERHYTARLLRLVTLSPQWAEAVLRGDHSPLLTVAQLTTNLSMEWEKQRLLH